MHSPHNWISVKIFSPRKEWSRLLRGIDHFLNTEAIEPLINFRIIEFNHTFNNNICLFILPQPDTKMIVTTMLQTFLKEGNHINELAGTVKTAFANEQVLAIRELLSDIMIEAFAVVAVEDETTFVLALYLYLILLSDKATVKDALQIFAGTLPPGHMVAFFEKEYAQNREMFIEMKDHIKNKKAFLPPWISTWERDYKAIVSAGSEHSLILNYRRTLYLLINQLGLSKPLVLRLEYYAWELVGRELLSVIPNTII